MYSFLPDELLKEILAPALQVPDESFACIDGRSPFSANYGHSSTSSYLLVCKDWLRVATPLLYTVVVLRSRAQIQALEFAIQSTPVLSSFIKKLRIESGYCGALYTILRACGAGGEGEKKSGGLTDLCLSMEVYSSDNVSSVCRGLGFVNPKRIIVFDVHHSGTRQLNQKAQQFLNSIQFNFERWSNLKILVLPSWSSSWGGESKYDQFVEAICKSETIETVSIIPPYTLPSWFDKLSKHPSIKKIILRGTAMYSGPFAQKINGSSQLRNLVQWGESTASPPSLFPTSRSSRPGAMTIAPMSETPSQKNWLNIFPDPVWTNILFYTLGLDRFEQEDFWKVGRQIDITYHTSSRRRYQLVCKKFYTLLKPLYYRCIIFTARDNYFEKLVSHLRDKPELSAQIKTFLTVDRSHSGGLTQSLSLFLADAVNLQRVSTAYTSWASMYSHSSNHDVLDFQALSVLAQAAGSTLVDLCLHLHRPTMVKPVDVFYKFTALRNLEFSSSARFGFESGKVKKDVLKRLECLICSSINNTFLSFLSCADLPNIREARFPVLDKCEGAITFLRKHGSKIRTLELGFLPGVSIFDICPNLEEFIVPSEKPGFAVAEFFSSTNEHPLHTLHITTRDVAKGAEKERFKYVGGLDLCNFTSLLEIQIDKCVWPTTENEIKKSHWVAWAERLQELYEVEIVNSEEKEIKKIQIPRLRCEDIDVVISMYSSLPDELIKEILTPLLQVPDEAFACVVPGESPFANYLDAKPKASSYLLVCQDWLRIASPLLYAVVVLRSKAQMQALEWTMKETPVLAGFIKKLRIEGQYSNPLEEILKRAKSLTDLCVSLEIYSTDSVSGFCKGLTHIQPHRLIVYDTGYQNDNRHMDRRNQKAQTIFKVLQNTIPKWDRLTDITLPWFSRDEYHPMIVDDYPQTDAFADSLYKSPSIRTVALRVKTKVPAWIKQLAVKLPTLKKITLMTPYDPTHPKWTNHEQDLLQAVQSDLKLKSLVRCAYLYKDVTDPRRIAPEDKCFWKGLESKGDVQVVRHGIETFPRTVWENIIFYALSLPELEESIPLAIHRRFDVSLGPYDLRCRRLLALTCKKFHDLALPLYYRFLIVTSRQDIISVAKSLSRNKKLGKYIRTFLSTSNTSSPQDLHTIWSLAPNIRHVLTSLPYRCKFKFGIITNKKAIETTGVQALRTLAETAGPQLVELAIRVDDPQLPKALDVFDRFSTLKHLHFGSSAIFTYDEPRVTKSTFWTLETITVRCCNDTLLSLLSIMELPSLQAARFPSEVGCQGVDAFLRKHGQKLRALECTFTSGVCVFDVCPNLEVFQTASELPGPASTTFFSCSFNHPLKRIHVQGNWAASRGTSGFSFLKKIDLSSFTSLEQVKVDDCTWPATEKEISKNKWVSWAERLRESFNATLVNGRGQAWVPRLKARK
ncbi:hypothetical protein NP233_g6116 [Leucocoprinus birnbaumii]|uniref:Uncharacterized protein n=1 Tax=Leucocoprinus birnbaumii TaxID=56174 RepID=A0AAD5YVU9_9AGAR|nr:hypothetical protein NP233_g6116 [Leucocoprinus birnbaumii]